MLASSLQTADRRKGRSRRVRTLQAGAATASGRGGSGSGTNVARPACYHPRIHQLIMRAMVLADACSGGRRRSS
jgi:hypothetical protein